MNNKKVKIGSALLAVMGFATSCGKGNDVIQQKPPVELYSETYQNIIYPKTASGKRFTGETPDPSIVKGDDGYFYIFTTGMNGGQSFRSKDCVNWEVHLTPVIPRPTWGDNKPGNTPVVWAPDVVKINDKWIYYYSLSGWSNPIGVGYAVADEIAGPYVDQGKLFTCEEIGLDNAIDPCIFIEDDHIYMAVGSFQGIDLVELNSEGTGLKGGAAVQRKEKTLIAGIYGGWDGATYEGSYIIKKDEYYYFFGSMGNCCAGKESTYKVVCGRSKSIKGPYLDDKNRPMANTRNNGSLVVWCSPANEDVAGPGHNSIFKDDAGDYWIVYHAFTKDDKWNNRHLFMDKLVWNEKGWPKVDTTQPSYKVEKDGPKLALTE